MRSINSFFDNTGIKVAVQDMCFQWMLFAILIGVMMQSGSAHDDGECSDRSLRFSLLTYNAALTPLIGNYEKRKAGIPKAIQDVDADVVCLQEVTYESDMRNILRTLGGTYPYSWSFLHSSIFSVYEILKPPNISGKAFPCDVEEYQVFEACIESLCSNYTGYYLGLCTLHLCASEVLSLPTECMSCIAGSAQTLDMLADKCNSEGEGEEAYRVQYQPQDILILSKLPILGFKRVEFIPGVKQFFPRGLLEVDIFKIGKVVCTHLTADLPGLPYIEVFVNKLHGISSYEEQQVDEIAKIEEMYGAGPLIIAGDFNFGPTIADKDIYGMFPQHFTSMLDQGFSSPYVEMDGKCTYCADNPLALPLTSILDHVLFRGYRTLSAMRISNNKTDPLSDHYGVKVIFCALWRCTQERVIEELRERDESLKQIFNWFVVIGILSDIGRLFQRWGAAMEKALSPIPVLLRGVVRRYWSPDRRD